MTRKIKQNPYSEALSSALQAVAGISSPDYLLMPIEPNPAMVLAGAKAANISAQQAREAYSAMMTEWALGMNKC